jgi:hypothetical protein
VLNEYHAQTDGPRFKVSVSRWGLHIIPAQLRNAYGQFINTTSILDTKITVPVNMRTPGGHFAAICDAVSFSNPKGITLKPNSQWINHHFSVTPLPRYLITDEQLEQISFEWGTTDIIAREAIIDFLEHSATTMTWKVLCAPDEGFCVFNLSPVMYDIKNPDGTLKGRKALRDDRLK